MPMIRRLIFVLLVTAISVFFSEKAYWYPQGYDIALLITFYTPTIYVVLWAIDAFKINSLSGMILISAVYAFLVEGVITPVMFEGGILSPFMPAYFIGWHGLLSIVFGFYLIRRWLVNRNWKMMLGGSAFFGLLWGVWSITYWLPENGIEWGTAPGITALTEQTTYWTPVDFGLHAFTFTLMLMLGHGLLSLGMWQHSFVLNSFEKVGLIAFLIFLYATLSFPGAPLGLLTLIPLLGLVFGVLWFKARQREGEWDTEQSMLERLQGPINYLHLLPLLIMPLIATLIYGIVQSNGISYESLKILSDDFSALQGVIGGILFVWALGRTVRLSIGAGRRPLAKQRV